MRSTPNKRKLFSFTIFFLFAGSLISSLFFKNNQLWTDEILSYLFISDPSIAHLNDAIVSKGLDANPPLFTNLYWFIAHAISQNVLFLRAVSIATFAITLALFYHYTTGVIGKPTINFIGITALAALTYLNITLADQIRTYTLFLLISFVYFSVMHRLTRQPASTQLLIAHTGVGLLLSLTHNFGLFYLAAAGAFFGLLWIWSKDRRYGYVLGTFVLILVVWLLTWYPSFAIQAKAGDPHSWIPLPTLPTFFEIVGELAPTVSVKLETMSAFPVLAMLRFAGLVALFAYIAVTKLKNGFRAAVADSAFMLYLLAGFMYFTTILIALVVSQVYTSVFISRYLWPNHLLVIYQLLYAFYYVADRNYLTRLFRRGVAPPIRRAVGWLLPVYMLGLAGMLFYRSQKKTLAPTDVMAFVAQLDKKYPVFLESSFFFMPVWYYNSGHSINFLLDYESAFDPRNKDLSASVAYHTLTSAKEKYNVGAVMPLSGFNANRVPHFFVVDEGRNYQIERFIQNKSVKVVRVGSTILKDVRILECVFNSATPDTEQAPTRR